MNPIPITWTPNDDHILDEDKRVLRSDGEQWCRPDMAPGTSSWSRNMQDEIVGLLFVCPCGCGSIGDLSIKEGYGGSVWRHNGDFEHPTLEPSVQKTSPCRWHGFLERGFWCLNRSDVIV